MPRRVGWNFVRARSSLFLIYSRQRKYRICAKKSLYAKSASKKHLGNFESFITEWWGLLRETQRIHSKLPRQSCFLSLPHLCRFCLSRTWAAPSKFTVLLQRKRAYICPFPWLLRLIPDCQHVVYLSRLLQPFQRERRLALRVFSKLSKGNWCDQAHWGKSGVTTMVTIPTAASKAASPVQSHRNCSLFSLKQLFIL